MAESKLILPSAFGGYSEEDYIKSHWLELGDVRKIRYQNPLLSRDWDSPDQLVRLVVELCRNPNYLHFVAKHILNIELLPYQMVVVKQLWTHQFPMLLGSRGSAKCVTGDTLIWTNRGLSRMDEIVDKQTPLRQPLDCDGLTVWDGRRARKVNYAWNQGYGPVRTIITESGKKLSGRPEHRVAVGGKENSPDWKQLSDLKVGDVVLCKSPHNHKFARGLNKACHELPYRSAYLLGLQYGFCLKSSNLDRTRLARRINHGIQAIPDINTALYHVKYDELRRETLQLPRIIREGNIRTFQAFLSGLTAAAVEVQQDTFILDGLSGDFLRHLQTMLLLIGVESVVSQIDNGYRLVIDSLTGRVKFAQAISPLRCGTKLAKCLSKYRKLRPGNHRFKNRFISEKIVQITEGEEYTFDINVEKTHRYFTNNILSHNSFLMSVYCVLRALLHQGCKIIVVGSSLRQSLVLYNYISTIWDRAPILQDICGGKNNKPKRDPNMCYWECGASKIMFLPMGNGDTIRGMRGNYILADEIASIDPEVFQTVVRGFAAVKSEGTVHSVQKRSRQQALVELGKRDRLRDKDHPTSQVPTILPGNQIIMGGTAIYQFNHLFKDFCFYQAIIETRGNAEKLRQQFPTYDIDGDIDAKQYSIIRLPYDSLPEGMMDKSIINQARLTMDPNIFMMEYGVVFPADSQGFYLASEIEGATCKREWPNVFPARLKAISEGRYYLGVDPASEDDNFAVSVVEQVEDHRRLVYCWTTTRKDFEELRKLGYVKNISDYNTFCIRHLRDLIRRFNISMIAMDRGGGGIPLRELFRDSSKIEPGEVPILDVDEDYGPNEHGVKALKMIDFSSYKWRCEAHYALKKDISAKRLLFPYHDSAAIAVENVIDEEKGKCFDTLEDCYYEILECKTETTFIKHSTTPAGLERWDLPGGIGLGSETTRRRLKKDRFTSLLLANWIASVVEGEPPPAIPGVAGVGMAGTPNTPSSHLYYGDGFRQSHIVSTFVSKENTRISKSGGRRIIY